MRKKLAYLPLVALLSLASCSQHSNSVSKPDSVVSDKVSASTNTGSVSSNSSTGSSSTVSNTPSTPSVSTDKTTIIDVAKSYALTLDVSGCTVSLSASGEDGKYEAGSSVTATVSLSAANLVIDKVVLNDVEIYQDSPLVYTFNMPNQDSVLKVTTKQIGEMDVLDVDDIVEEDIPTLDADKYTDVDSIKTFSESLRTYLKAGDMSEMDHMSYATYKSYGGVDLIGNLFSSSDSSISSTNFASTNVDLRIDCLKDDAVRFTCNKRGSYQESTNFASFERGLYQNGYFERYQSISSGGTSKNQETYFYDVVDDDTEGFSDKTMVKQSDSAFRSNAVGFGSKLCNTFLKPSSSYSLDYTSYGGKLYNTISNVSTTVSADKKSVEFDINYVNKSFGKEFDYKFVVDGNGMVIKADYICNKYEKTDFDAETGLLVPGAKGELDSDFHLVVNRGFKIQEEKTDISQYAMTDYDVNFETKLEGQSSKMVSDYKLENSTTIQGCYAVPKSGELYKSPMGMISPVLVGTQAGEEDFLEKTEDGKYVVKKEGTFHLVFDNRFGSKKTFEVTSVKPNPYSIETDFGGFCYVNKEMTFNASVSPSGATQSVTCKLLDGDTTASTIVDKGNGVFALTSTAVGEGTLEISSTVDPTIKKEIKFKSYEMPNIDTLKANLKDKTLSGVTTRTSSYGYDTDYDGSINFNPDDSGLKGTATFKMESTYSKQTKTFDWTLDPNTFAITISNAPTLWYMDFKSILVISSDKMVLNFKYDGDAITSTYTFGDHVDF